MNLLAVVRKEGLSVLISGWHRLFYRQSITWIVYMNAYDKYRKIALDYRNGETITKTDKFVVNALTGISASLLNVPFDMLKTQAQKVDPLTEKGTYKAFLKMFDAHGFKGYYRSLPIRMTRSTFIL